MKTAARVAIIMGSQSDWATLKHAADTLDALGIAHEARIVSAHRTPDRLVAFAKGAEKAGFHVIIAGAGGAAHLPGMAASMTRIPVLGVPIESAALKGVDSLHSIVQMPAGIPVPAFANVESLDDLHAALARLGTPCVLKTRTMGYDGKGQAKIMSPAEAEAAWQAIGRKPAIAEAFVPFSAEVSVIVARGRDGQTAVFDIPLNEHRNHILHRSSVPSGLSEATEKAAREIGQKLAQSFDYVGVMAVELFVVGDRLLVNEIAPRVHNSGHWTESACMSSQFEQHIRAVVGWPLAATERFADVEMTNLIGAELEDWAKLAAEPGAALHLYGKAEARQGRKMGHVNRLKQR